MLGPSKSKTMILHPASVPDQCNCGNPTKIRIIIKNQEEKI